jgi:hypothetical protein
MSMIALLEVTRCIIIAVNRSYWSGRRVCQMTLIVRIAEWTGLSITLLTETWILRRRLLGACRISTAFGASWVLRTTRIEAYIFFSTLWTWTGDYTVRWTNWLEVAFLAEGLEAIVWELAICIGVLGGR